METLHELSPKHRSGSLADIALSEHTCIDYDNIENCNTIDTCTDTPLLSDGVMSVKHELVKNHKTAFSKVDFSQIEMKYTNDVYLNPIALHDLVYQSGCPNFKGIKHQVPSTMNIELWCSLLQD